MSDDQDISFAAGFPAASREDWLKLVSGVLKGAPFEGRLVSKTYDGLAIEPLYGRDAAARPVIGRSPGAPWQVMTRIEHPDPAAANSQALHDLENGATGLSLVFAGSIGAYGFGIENSKAALERVLRNIHLDAGISLDLQADGQPEHVAAALSAVLAKRGTVPT